MLPQPEIRCIVTTFPKVEEATKAVRTIVREQLAACGTLLRGARSIYIWQGDLVDAEEIVVILKTTAEATPGAIARLQSLHPHEVPEILVLSPESVNAAYARWIGDSIQT